MGELSKRKNYTTTIKAIAKLNNKNIHYLICGEGPELLRLQKLAKKLKIESQIHFLGFREDIKELLQISNIYISASKQEGLPRATMEAMAMGLPCIVSNIRGHIDLIEDNKGGYLCNNIQDFSSSILKLLNNPLR